MAIESTPDSGVAIRNDAVAPLLAPWRFSDAAAALMLPVVVDIEGDRPEFDPAPLLRELASLARDVSFAGLTVHATDERHYSARLMLRLQNPAATP